MYPFEGLWIWALSLEVDKLVYKLSYKLPKTEQFGGLASQMRRAAVSISLNIAEGKTSGSDAEFRRFLRFSLRSLNEVIASIKVAIALKLLKEEEAEGVFSKCDELGAGINAFIATLTKAIDETRAEEES
jgi:four helix bundle protein